MSSHGGGEWWLRGQPVAGTAGARLAPEWRPAPRLPAVLLPLVMVAVGFITARQAHTLGEHASVFVVVGCGSPAVLAVVRWVTGRRPVFAAAFAEPRALRLAVVALVCVAPLLVLALGLPPEDGALAALPLLWLADEALIATGVASPHRGPDR